MSGSWHRGNAAEDGRETRGWILGHFVNPAECVRASRDVEVKWAVHPAAAGEFFQAGVGDQSAAATAGDTAAAVRFCERSLVGREQTRSPATWKPHSALPTARPKTRSAIAIAFQRTAYVGGSGINVTWANHLCTKFN